MKEVNAQSMLDVIDGRTSLGIEFGSTRIKAVLIDSSFTPIAAGSYEWENKLENGIWTYSLEDIWKGLRVSYRKWQQKYSKSMRILRQSGRLGSVQ